MEALLVFPYFLVKLLARIGAEPAAAEWGAAVLSSICFVLVMMAPFHPRDIYKTCMAGVSWVIIVMAAAGCIWECKDAQQSPGTHSQARAEAREIALPQRKLVNLGEA